MIITLADTFTDIDLAENDICRIGIDAICQSVARGEHYLIATRDLVIKMSEDGALSKTSRGVMRWLRSDYSFLASLLKNFRYGVEICPIAERFERKANSLEWRIPVSHVADYGIRPTILLAENSHDGDVYVYAAKHYAIESKLSKLKIKIEPRNGNGASISQELDRIARAKIEFCLCVTDSDRLAPGCEPGTIPRACSRVVHDCHSVVHHVAPDSRELENAIPTTLFGEVAASVHPDEWIQLQDRLAIVDAETVAYADLKNGTSLDTVLKLRKGSPPSTFWLEQAQRLFAESNCLARGACEDPETCGCVVVPGFGDNIAKTVRQNLEGCSAHASHRTAKGASNFGAWITLGREVFEAGVAPSRMRL